MERFVQIKIIKDSKILNTYRESFLFSNTTTIKTLKELCQKKFPSLRAKEISRESFLSDGLEISEKRVVPQKTNLEYLIYLDSPSLGRTLNRRHHPDSRDHHYPLASLLIKKAATKAVTLKLWEANGWWGDQGDSPECVGYAWAHWLDDKPINKTSAHPVISPHIIYDDAKKFDEWPGESYDGTSVRGGVKALKNKGKVVKYYWGFDLSSLINTVLNLGPVVVGTSWYEGMFYPAKSGLIKIAGSNAGGHAYLINGIDLNKKLFRIKNSWGKDWGLQGHAWISFADMARLIRENGEICFAA